MGLSLGFAQRSLIYFLWCSFSHNFKSYIKFVIVFVFAFLNYYLNVIISSCGLVTARFQVQYDQYFSYFNIKVKYEKRGKYWPYLVTFNN